MIDPTSNRQRRPLNRMLFMLAKNYADSAKILEDRVQEIKNPDPAPVIIMCLSFAIELLLKCLLIVDKDEIRTVRDMEKAGINRRGHDYLHLFDRIERPYQEIILKHFAKHDSSVQSIESLKLLLGKIGSDPFTLWRYVHEQDEIPTFNLRAYKRFGGSLRDAITEIWSRRAQDDR